MPPTISPAPQTGLTACGGTLPDTTGYPAATFRGRTVYFCTRACRRVFETDPERFMAGDIAHPLDEDPEP